jgi:hypothetical protein
LLIIVETFNPPKPVPLTIACTPAIFVPPGQNRRYAYGSAPKLRVADPCPHLSWRRMQTAADDVISVLVDDGANIQRANFFPASKLVHGDGRVYSNTSLPAVGDLLTTYHHDSIPFLSTKNHTREHLLDPRQRLPGPLIRPTSTGWNKLPETSVSLLGMFSAQE